MEFSSVYCRLLRNDLSSSHSRALFVLRFSSRRLEKEKIRNNRADDELRRSFGWISLDELLLRTLSRPCEVDLRPSSSPRIISTMSVEETISKSSSPVGRVSGAAAVATKTSSRVKCVASGGDSGKRVWGVLERWNSKIRQKIEIFHRREEN